MSKSDVVEMSVGCGVKTPVSGSCDVHVSVSWVGTARTVTIREKVRVEGSFWIWSVLQGRALPRARVECFVTFVLGAAAYDVGFDGVADSAEPLEMN